jgi:hypothetical protein
MNTIQLFRDVNGKPRIRIRGRNHEIILTSEDYTRDGTAKRRARKLSDQTGWPVVLARNWAARAVLAALFLAAGSGCSMLTAGANQAVSTKAFSVLTGSVSEQNLGDGKLNPGETLVYNRYADSLSPDVKRDLTKDASIMGALQSGNAAAAVQLLDQLGKAGEDAVSELIGKNRALHEQFIRTTDPAAATLMTASFFSTRTPKSTSDIALSAKLDVQGSPVTMTVTQREVQVVTNAAPAPAPSPTTAADPNLDPPPLPPASPVAPDDADLAGAETIKGPDPTKADVTHRLGNVRMAAGHVDFDFEPEIPWSRVSAEVGGSTKTTDGIMAIYWPEAGRLVGGKFDWHGVGQKSKTLANIPGGYLNGRQPPSGSPIYFLLISREGGARSNLARSADTWP